MVKRRIPRRAFLWGIGGVAVALPALEIMGDGSGGRARADGDPIPKRYMASYMGLSTGRDFRRDGSIVHDDKITPSATGTGYDLPLALRPLGGGDIGGASYGNVTDHVAIVTGLRIATGGSSSLPAGGRTVEFHGNTAPPQFAGTKARGRNDAPTGPTSDQVAAAVIGGGKGHLAYIVETRNYVNGSTGGNSRRMSWRRRSGGGVEAIDNVISPRRAYERLFTGYAGPSMVDTEGARLELTRRQTVLDLVRGNAERLNARLGRVDQVRLERHFDELRTLETRIDALDVGAGLSCDVPPHPGDDPAIGATGDATEASSSNKYSNEELRAEILADLIYIAFACDMNRTATLQFTGWKSYLNMYQIFGDRIDAHGTTHWNPGGNIDNVSRSVAWSVKHFARLTDRLANTPEVDGSSVLDHTAMTLCFEGGHGRDPESDKAASPHSTENMSVLVAGHAGGLRTGQHVRARGRHPGEAILSALRGVGVDESLGDLDNPIAELLP